MFKSTFFHSLDTKGRIAIPKQLREMIPRRGAIEVLVVTQGFDGCLFAYPIEAWQKIEEKASQLSILDEGARNFIRFFISPASECVIDKLGRIMLPANLREYAKIDKEVVIAGAGERIEIWSKEMWEQYWQKIRNSEDKFIEQMKNIGL